MRARSNRSSVKVIRLTYKQGLALFFCSFLALRFEDNVSPIGKITDYCILKEQELFAG